jgi:hypothetical protein
MISPYADPNSSWQNTKEITGTPRSSARLFDIWAIEDEAYQSIVHATGKA